MWIKSIELPHLAVSAPPQVPVAGSYQVHRGDVFEAARGVEAGGRFAGERLIVDKAVRAGRANGPFVEMSGIEVTPRQPGKLGANQPGTVLKILRAVLGPDLELPVVRSQGFHVRDLPIRWNAVSGFYRTGSRQSGVEVVLGLLKECGRSPEEDLCLSGRL